MNLVKKILYLACALGLLASSPAALALTYQEITGTAGSAATAYPYPTGALVNDSGTIYFISGAVKVPFANWPAFVGLGYDLKNVSSGSLSSYAPAQTYVIDTASASHPWGQWLSYRGTVYYFVEAGLIPVPSPDIFTADGGQWNMVVPANKYDLNTLQAAPNLPLLTVGDLRLITAPTYSFGGTANPSGGAPDVPDTATGTPMAAQPETPAAQGSLNQPTLSAASPAGRFVLSGLSQQTAAVFNFTASGSPVTITGLDFTLQNITTGGTVPPISWISAGSGSATVLPGATTSLSNLSINVPTAGVDVPIIVNYAAVNPANSPANQAFTLTLAGVRYSSGGQAITLPAAIAANPMALVSSMPTLTISGPAGPLTIGQVLLGQVTIAASGGGGITLNQLPLHFAASGNAAASGTPNNLLVTDNGFTVNTSNSAVSFATSSAADAAIIFNGDNFIAPNTAKTYNIYLPIQGAVGSSAGPSAVATSLGDPSGFIWTDVAGGTAGANIAGSANGVKISNYPANAVSASN
ncbi:MAG TPA: hypothetical protein VHA30_03185 [Patescibacteria group bacterium]|nr:hypothetical protein [Patescibacteria group bacterium]